MTDFYKIGIDARAARMQRLALEALKAWDITDCEPELIKIRENAVFRIRRANGFDAALRIHRYGYHSDAALQSELSWMHALQQDGIEVPEIIPPAAARFSSQQAWKASRSPARSTWYSGLRASRSAVSKRV